MKANPLTAEATVTHKPMNPTERSARFPARVALTALALIAVAATHAQNPAAITPEKLPAAAEPKLTVIVDLVDGSRVMGVPGIAELKVDSQLGKLKLPIRNVAKVVFKPDAGHTTAEVTLTNGDLLKGVVEPAILDLEAVWGKVAIGSQHVRTLTIQDAAAATPAVEVRPENQSVEEQLQAQGKRWEQTPGEIAVGVYVQDILEGRLGQPEGRGAIGKVLSIVKGDDGTPAAMVDFGGGYTAGIYLSELALLKVVPGVSLKSPDAKE